MSPVGLYSTVSQSEWEIELSLNADHSAVARIATWEPGEGDQSSKSAYQGKWRVENARVEAVFREDRIVFRFDPHLSFAEFQKDGAAEGLVGISGRLGAFDFKDLRFWSKSALKKVEW